MALKRPNKLQYAMYDPRGKAKYKADLAKYYEAKREADAKKNKLSTEKNIKKQKTSNKKTATKTKTTKGTTTTKPTSTAAKGKSLATGKATSKTKAVETPQTKTVTKTVTKKPVAKKPVTKKPVAKKPVAKKPVAKKPVAKKPVAKKPVAKKPAGKVPAKKPLISNKNKLRIKKAATTAKNTTVKTAKTVGKKLGEAKKTVNKKVAATKKVLTKKGATPRPKTRLQKLASGANKRLKTAGEYTRGPLKDKIVSKSGKIIKGIATKGGLVRGIKNAGLSIAAERLTDAAQKRIAKATTKRGRNQTYKEFSSDFDKMRKERRVLPTTLRTLKGVGNVLTGKKYTHNNKTLSQKLNEEERAKRQNNQSSTTRNINKQKKNNKNQNNSGLKIKKTQRSNKKNNNVNYNASTRTKTQNKKLPEFRTGDANRQLQLENQNKKKITYDTVNSRNRKNLTNQHLKKDGSKQVDGSRSAKPGSARAKMRQKNIDRFGKSHVDKLRAKNKDFQAMKKKKLTKTEFIKRYPNSQTAKRARGM